MNQCLRTLKRLKRGWKKREGEVEHRGKTGPVLSIRLIPNQRLFDNVLIQECGLN